MHRFDEREAVGRRGDVVRGCEDSNLLLLAICSEKER